MAQCTADFRDGVNAATIATTDPGSQTPFDLVTLGASGGTAIYDNAIVYRNQILSGKITAGSAGAKTSLRWNAALGTVTDHYGRLYMYVTANPAAAFPVMQLLSGASNAFNVRFQTTGKFTIRDAGGADRAGPSTNTVNLNAWTRLEWHVTHDAVNGFGELKIFLDPDATGPDETLTFPTPSGTLASADRIDFTTQAASYSIQLANLVAGAPAYPGPWTAGALVYADQRVRRNSLLRRCSILVPKLWLPSPGELLPAI